MLDGEPQGGQRALRVGPGQLGARPAAKRQMSLKLTDVASLTVDARAAALPTGTIDVQNDGAASVTVASLAPGTAVSVNGRRVTAAGADGSATVRLASGSSVIVLGAAGSGSGSHGGSGPGAKKFSCAKPTGRLSGRALGPVRLGITRRAARARFPGATVSPSTGIWSPAGNGPARGCCPAD